MLSVALVVLLSYFVYRKFVGQAAPLPPGPKPWPLLGNITDLRPNELWLLASDWAKRYGRSLRIFLLFDLSKTRPRRRRILARLRPGSPLFKLSCCRHRTHGETERDLF